MVRATSGDARTVTVGDLTVVRVVGAALDLTITSPVARTLIVDTQPTPGNNATVDGAVPALVVDEDALYACAASCILIEGTRARVATMAASAHVVVAP